MRQGGDDGLSEGVKLAVGKGGKMVVGERTVREDEGVKVTVGKGGKVVVVVRTVREDEGVKTTVAKRGKVVVGERTVREDAKGEVVRHTSAESWRKRTIGWFLFGF